METISVSNLDGGYEQCSGLVNHITGDGASLIETLVEIITDLNVNWKGSDATKHITNLKTVHDQLHALLSDAKNSVAYAASRIIAIQEVRSANGGGGSVGESLSGEALPLANVSLPEDTSEYKVELGAAKDLEQLTSACEKYTSFMSKFLEMKGELLGNWTAGAQREKAVQCFDELEANSETYKKYMTDARDNLDIAVANINQLEG